MNQDLQVIGEIVKVDVPSNNLVGILARVDTGAQTSAIWASGIKEHANGTLSFVLFDKPARFYSGEVLTATSYLKKTIISSNGSKEQRYAVKLRVSIEGRSINATFSLANRSRQKYPILVGRNLLRGKFIVNIKHQVIG